MKKVKGESFDCKPGVLVPFLRVESDQRATSPPPPAPFPLNTSDENFEMNKLLKIFQRLYNKTPGVVSYAMGAYFGS